MICYLKTIEIINSVIPLLNLYSYKLYINHDTFNYFNTLEQLKNQWSKIIKSHKTTCLFNKMFLRISRKFFALKQLNLRKVRFEKYGINKRKKKTIFHKNSSLIVYSILLMLLQTQNKQRQLYQYITVLRF